MAERICEDCGLPQDGSVGQARRRRCPECDRRVCSWCWWHIHKPAALDADMRRLGLTV